MSKPSIKVGDVFPTNFNGDCEVIAYKDCYNITVQFKDTKSIRKCRAEDLRRGKVKDKIRPLIEGVGYYGEGSFLSHPSYTIWKDILERCYNTKSKTFKNYGSKGVKVCEEWYNYQNFAKWYEENYPTTWEEEKAYLDKDLRIWGSKFYSPDTCMFVTRRVNNFFAVKYNKTTPIGVYRNKYTGNYVVGCNNLQKKKINLGTFRTEEEAFEVYKTFKQKLQKELALEELEAGRFTQEVYENFLKIPILPYPE